MQEWYRPLPPISESILFRVIAIIGKRFLCAVQQHSVANAL